MTLLTALSLLACHRFPYPKKYLRLQAPVAVRHAQRLQPHGSVSRRRCLQKKTEPQEAEVRVPRRKPQRATTVVP